MRSRPSTILRVELLEDRSVPSATDLIALTMGSGALAGNSFAPSISADGRFIAYTSQVERPLPGTSPIEGLYVADRITGATQMVTGISYGDKDSVSISNASISADGRYVLFERDEVTPSDVVQNSVYAHPDIQAGTSPGAGATQATSDLFIWDRLTGNTQAVGDPNLKASSASISGNDQFVVFVGNGNVYLLNLQTNVTELISMGQDGLPMGGSSPSVSDDGRYVAFSSTSYSDLGGQSVSTVGGVYVRDRLMGTTRQIQLPQALEQSLLLGNVDPRYGQLPPGLGPVTNYSGIIISGNGAFVAFNTTTANADGSLPGRPVYVPFVQNLSTGQTDFIPTPSGLAGTNISAVYAISQDGRFVSYSYVDDSENAIKDAVWDRQLGTEQVFGTVIDPTTDTTPIVSSNGLVVVYNGYVDVWNPNYWRTIYVSLLNDPNAPITPPPSSPPVNAPVPTSPPASVSTPSDSTPSAEANADSTVFLAAYVDGGSTDIALLTSGHPSGVQKSVNQLPDTNHAASISTVWTGNDFLAKKHGQDNFLSLDPTLTGTLAT